MGIALLLLVGGAELLVRAALRLAQRLHVRPLIIGLSLVAFGSTAPQMTVSLQAAYQGAPDVAVGSVIGSNIFNVLVTNTANQRSVVVRINDRGPHTRGRLIDLSRAAAEKIGMLRSGTARVRVQGLSD